MNKSSQSQESTSVRPETAEERSKRLFNALALWMQSPANKTHPRMVS